MRYFTEDKEYLGEELDTDIYEVLREEENEYIFKYVITQEYKSHLEHNEIPYPEGDKVIFPNGEVSYIDHEIVDQEEEGYWKYYGEFCEDDVPLPPDDFPHEMTLEQTETVAIVKEK